MTHTYLGVSIWEAFFFNFNMAILIKNVDLLKRKKNRFFFAEGQKFQILQLATRKYIPYDK